MVKAKKSCKSTSKKLQGKYSTGKYFTLKLSIKSSNIINSDLLFHLKRLVVIDITLFSDIICYFMLSCHLNKQNMTLFMALFMTLFTLVNAGKEKAMQQEHNFNGTQDIYSIDVSSPYIQELAGLDLELLQDICSQHQINSKGDINILARQIYHYFHLLLMPLLRPKTTQSSIIQTLEVQTEQPTIIP